MTVEMVNDMDVVDIPVGMEVQVIWHLVMVMEAMEIHSLVVVVVLMELMEIILWEGLVPMGLLRMVLLGGETMLTKT